MRLKEPVKLSQILSMIQFDGEIIGNPDVVIYGLNDEAISQSGDITWIKNKGYFHHAVRTKAHCIITALIPSVDVSDDLCVIVTKSPLDLFDKCIKSCYKNVIRQGVTNLIKSDIGIDVYIGKNVSIGENCIVYPHVTILDNVTIGDNVIIQSNSVIGSMPFANIRKKDGRLQPRKIWGDVMIGNNVEIGALCTIDRGITSTTFIGEGTKIDNQVHIGHDVIIGEDCSFSAQVGIAGYVEIMGRCSFWGKSSVTNRVKVASNTSVLGMSVVTKNVNEEGMVLIGYPAKDRLTYWKEQSAINNYIIRSRK